MVARLDAAAVRRAFLGLLVCAIVGTWAVPGKAFDKVNTDTSGLALKGYDTVAYFTEGRAMKGESTFSYTWHTAKWYFASAANRDRFAADPEHFAPQYGGYCAGNMTDGKVADSDPEAWKIINGKLYFTGSKAGIKWFSENAAEAIKQADENWQKLLDQR